jgi:hypothetical protein
MPHMPEAPLQPQTPLQHQIAQMALDLAAKLEAKAGHARPGQVLADCEALMLGDGRQFLRDSLAAALQQQARQEEKKGAPPAPVPADTPATTRDRQPGKS